MDYPAFIEELKEIILPVLTEEGIELVELHFVKARRKPILKLLVDKKQGGISLGECARLNEKIGSVLDAQNIIESGYIMEVSSPGLDRPLKTKSDFLRCINKKVKFFLSESVKGRLELDGIINKVEDDSVHIDIYGDIIEIPLVKITKAKQTLDGI